MQEESNSMTVPLGTKVRYHGSIEKYHGIMTVAGTHPERVPTNGEFSPIRYYLKFGEAYNDYLNNVRPESFTVVEEGTEEAVD